LRKMRVRELMSSTPSDMSGTEPRPPGWSVGNPGERARQLRASIDAIRMVGRVARHAEGASFGFWRIAAHLTALLSWIVLEPRLPRYGLLR
jgi:hypothetical protein